MSNTDSTLPDELDNILTKLEHGIDNTYCFKQSSEYEAKQEIIALIALKVQEARIDELLRHGRFSMPDKPSDFENQRLLNDRLAALHKTKEGV